MSEKGAKRMGYMRHGDASTYTSHDGMQRVTTLFMLELTSSHVRRRNTTGISDRELNLTSMWSQQYATVGIVP